MIDLTDVTFTIPLWVDSPQRLENIQFVIEFLNKNFDTRILVWEEGPQESNLHGCEHIFHKNNNPLFHHTRMLNEMARWAETDIIVNYDCDVIFPLDRYINSAKAIRNKKYDGIFPYGGLFVDIDRKWMNHIHITNRVADCLAKRVLSSQSVGGCIFWNRDKFIEGGMENENFLSWGYEDDECYHRFIKLGYRIGRLEGQLYHLQHPRGINSNINNPHLEKNKAEWAKIQAMSQDDLFEYVKNWPWLL